MRPVERLAVDIFLEQSFAHHQAEILASASPRRVGGLVDNMAKIVETPRVERLSGLEPMFAGLSALPGSGGEAEDLHLDAAAFQRSRQNVGASRRDRDGTPAHRSGIVDQQRDHGVAEIRILLAFERQRRLRIDHHPRESGGVQHALFQIEFPGPVLLSHQTALQPIRQTCDDRGEILQLLVEICAQAFEFLGITKILRANDFIELRRKRAIFIARKGRGIARRTMGGLGLLALPQIEFVRFVAGRTFLGLHFSIENFVRRLLDALRFLGLRGSVFPIASGFIRLIRLRLVVGAVFVLALLVGVALLGHVKVGEDFPSQFRESLLVLERLGQAVEIGAGARFDRLAPEFDQMCGRLGRRRSG